VSPAEAPSGLLTGSLFYGGFLVGGIGFGVSPVDAGADDVKGGVTAAFIAMDTQSD